MGRKSYKDQQQEVVEDPRESVITPAEESEVESEVTEEATEESLEVFDETPEVVEEVQEQVQETPEVIEEVHDEIPEVPEDSKEVLEVETTEVKELIPAQEDVKPENTKINLNTSKEMEKVKKEEVEREIEIPENSDKIVGIPKRSAFYKKLKGGARRTH